MTSLMISNALLWVLMLAVIVALWALARQVGILYERVAPMGALVTDAGPKLGEMAPRFELPALNGTLVAIGGEQTEEPAHLLPVTHLPGVQEAPAGAQIRLAGGAGVAGCGAGERRGGDRASGLLR